MSPSSTTTARPGSSQLPVTVVPTPPRVRGYRPPVHLADLDPTERRRLVVDAGYPSFRADQISRHYFAHGGETSEGWSDVPVRQRKELGELILPAVLDPVHTVSSDGGLTQKLLWRLTDGSLVETVLMRYPSSVGSGPKAGAPRRRGEPRPRVTVCVSSQSGCGMGCPFCATGQGGLARSLSTAEIVDQVVRVGRVLGEGPSAAEGAGVPGSRMGAGERITNVVFMGMGEPLANYAAVVRAARRLTAPVPAGFGLSARNLTVSTVGLIPAMQRLAGEQLPVTLALSLHAPDDSLRDELVPVNRRWPVRQCLDAAYDYFRATGRRISIEYALIRDVNDQPWRADLLASLLTTQTQGWAHVNLIPLNPTPGSRWTASRPEVAAEFQRRLQRAGVTTTVRDNRGQEAAAACGQLAGRWPALADLGEHGQGTTFVC